MKYYACGEYWDKIGEIVTQEEMEDAAALSNEDWDWTLVSVERRPRASFYPFDCTDEYIDYLETIGHGKVKVNYEVLHRMAEGI